MNFKENHNADRKNSDKYNKEDMLIGRNPIIEALRAERPINKIFMAEGERKGSIKEVFALAKEKRIIIQEVSGSFLNQISDQGNHQGIIALVSPFSYVELEDIITKANEKNEKAFIVIADGITDPHNLGALIRTAEAAGAHGLVIPKHHSVQITSTVAKSSAGAIEYLPVARETNIVRCIEKLKEVGLWVIGADMDGQGLVYEADMKGPSALVIGGEDKGIGRLVKENCDIIVRIPMKGNMSSLNASVAGAIMMYEVCRQRGLK